MARKTPASFGKPRRAIGKLVQRPVVIAIHVVMHVTQRQMGLGQIGLETHGFAGRGPCFLRPGGHRFDGVIAPAFHMRQARVRQREGRIELDRFFVERLDAGQVVVVPIRPAEDFVRLEIKQIGLAVFASVSSRSALVRRRKALPSGRRRFPAPARSGSRRHRSIRDRKPAPINACRWRRRSIAR